MTLRHCDLFSGIGGFALGLERSGLSKPVRFCEIDPYCQKVLAKHWPGVPIHDDITTMQFEEGEADVITGGFPCQDLSYAGRGAGLAGERSGLYRELVRAVRVVRPRYVIVENVAALLGRGLGTVLGDLAEIGYDAEWHCIPASYVGAPHRRDRIWIVGYPNDRRGNGKDGALQAGRAIAVIPGSHGGEGDVADADQQGPQGHWGLRECSRERAAGARCRSEPGAWLPEPPVGRLVDGLPNRVHRLRALGNAVVPQIPELIGRALLESEAA